MGKGEEKKKTATEGEGKEVKPEIAKKEKEKSPTEKKEHKEDLSKKDKPKKEESHTPLREKVGPGNHERDRQDSAHHRHEEHSKSRGFGLWTIFKLILKAIAIGIIIGAFLSVYMNNFKDVNVIVEDVAHLHVA